MRIAAMRHARHVRGENIWIGRPHMVARGMTPNDLVLTPTGLRFGGRRYPCTIGRGGISGAKREGDGATPAGIHRIVGMLYR
ncbi:MAG TPA: hypothetical protein DDZ54_09220, partial [Erythrobacter sp.]|nr:hypothetical protein [Erythrobacter sp.]